MKEKFTILLALVACIVTPAVAAERIEKEKTVPVPDGMMAVVSPDGSGYILVPGSPRDLKLAADGKAIIGARSPRGAQIIGHGRNLAATTESSDPPQLDDGGGGGRSCGEAWCGTLGLSPSGEWVCSGPCRNCEGIKACP